MDFTLNDEQQAVQRLFSDFSDREIAPAAAALDREPQFPEELFAKVAELGFFGMRYPDADGHVCDTQTYILAVEELARGSLAVAATCTMQSLMGTYFVHRHADDALRERLFSPAMRGEVVGTICMTEPNAGSDLLSMQTRAEPAGNRWKVTGQKTWITSAPNADMFTVFAKTGDKEMSILLVERGASGLTVGRSIDKMGVRASLTSEVTFDNTPAVLLGERGTGLASLREILTEIRVMTAALALGVGRAAYECALAYSKERTQFGKPICKFQAVQAHLAEMHTDLEAARRLTQWAAWLSDAGKPSANEAAMAKLFASEASVRICDRAARVMASYGFATDYPLERYMRDARFTLIGGGTSEILRTNIARELVR